MMMYDVSEGDGHDVMGHDDDGNGYVFHDDCNDGYDIFFIYF